MGSDRRSRTRLVTRCCYGASFGFGFVITVLTLAAMFWIAWCYFGLTIVQISDTQRRALVNYSYTTVKPTPSSISSPSRSTTIAPEETSVNSISKLPTTASVLRGSSRGESPIKVDKKKETAVPSSFAKGDLASRDRTTHNTNVAASASQGKPVSIIPPPRGPLRSKDETHVVSGEKASILTGSSADDSEEDSVYVRKVLPPGSENRPVEQSDSSNRRNPPEPQADSRLDISPTKVYDIEGSSRSSQGPDIDKTLREEARTQPRDTIDREGVSPSRRDDPPSSRRSEPEPVYREPDFDREYPRRRSSDTDRDRTRYDDFDDERGSRSRYDRTDRGRESDDRYSKGDTRVYPDDRGLRPEDEDRFRDRPRERYPVSSSRRGDDDRYEDRHRDYDERPRYRDRDSDTPRYRDKVIEERPPLRDDRYKDDDQYRSRYDDGYKSRDEYRPRSRDDDRPRSRDDDRPRPRDDDRPRPRDDDRPRSRDDDRPRSRDDDRPRSRDDDMPRSRDDDMPRSRDDDRPRSRDDERPRSRDDERYRSRDDDRYRVRDEDRYRSRDGDGYRSSDDDRYRSRTDDRYRGRDDDRYIPREDDRNRRDPDDRRDSHSSYRDDKETYRSRTDYDALPSKSRDEDSRESIIRSSAVLASEDRKLSSSRSRYDVKEDGIVTDYDVASRDRSRSYPADIIPSRISRPLYEEERYRDRDREDDNRRSRYDDDEKIISPTKTRDGAILSRSTLIDSRSKDVIDDRRYIDDRRDRIKDDRYYSRDDRIGDSRLQGSRGSISSSSDNSRTVINDRDEYRTKVPSERTDNTKVRDGREEVILDHRSYGSEKDEEYRRKDSRRDYDYDDRIRRPSEDTRQKNNDEESYSRRDSFDDGEYERSRTRTSYDRDRTRSRDSSDDDYRRYDDKYRSIDDDRYVPKDDRSSAVPVRKYDSLPDDEVRLRPRDSEIRTMRKEDPMDGNDRLRPSESRADERFYSDGAKSSSRRRYDDDLPLSDHRDFKDDFSDDRRHSGSSRHSSREPLIGPSMTTVYSREPSEVVIREKRYQNTEKSDKSSRDFGSDEVYRDKSYLDSESDTRSKDPQIRPLSAKDVIEAAIRHSDTTDQNSRKVYYPVFDPRVSNLTSPEIIRPSERRGTTITARKRRSLEVLGS